MCSKTANTVRATLVIILWCLALAITPPTHATTTPDDCTGDDTPALLTALSYPTGSHITRDGLSISVQVTNTTTQTTGALSMSLRTTTSRLTTSKRVSSWLNGKSASARKTHTTTTELTAAPNSRLTLATTVPITSFTTEGSLPTGVYGIEVTVTDDKKHTSTHRSLAISPPTVTQTPAPVFVATPITANRVDPITGYTTPGALLGGLEPGSALHGQLAAARVPGTTWLLDPATFDPRSWRTTPTPLLPDVASHSFSDSEQAALNTWLQDLTTDSRNHESFLLPYFHPRLSGTTTKELSDAYDISNTVWPLSAPNAYLAGQTLTPGNIQTAGSAGTNTIFSPTPLASTDERAAGHRLNVTTDGSQVDIVSTSPTIADIVEPLDTDEPQHCLADDKGAIYTATTAATHLEALTLLASTTKNTSDPLILIFPNTWTGNQADQALLANALLAPSWTTSTSLASITPAVTKHDDIADDPELTGDQPRLTSIDDSISALAATWKTITGVDPTYPSRLHAGLTSSRWNPNTSDYTTTLENAATYIDKLTGAVHIQSGGDLNVISSEVNLPITIVNDLQAEAQVRVKITAKNPRLAPGDTVDVTIPPRSSRVVSYPVEARTDGRTSLTVSVLNTSGDIINQTTDKRVRIRKTWESKALVVVGAALSLFVVVGIARSISRGRRRNKTPEEPT